MPIGGPRSPPSTPLLRPASRGESGLNHSRGDRAVLTAKGAGPRRLALWGQTSYTSHWVCSPWLQWHPCQDRAPGIRCNIDHARAPSRVRPGASLAAGRSRGLASRDQDGRRRAAIGGQGHCDPPRPGTGHVRARQRNPGLRDAQGLDIGPAPTGCARRAEHGPVHWRRILRVGGA